MTKVWIQILPIQPKLSTTIQSYVRLSLCPVLKTLWGSEKLEICGFRTIFVRTKRRAPIFTLIRFEEPGFILRQQKYLETSFVASLEFLLAEINLSCGVLWKGFEPVMPELRFTIHGS